MKNIRVRLGVTGLVALMISAGHLFVPEPADAAGGAMFRVFVSWHGDIDATVMGETYSDPFYMAYSEPAPTYTVNGSATIGFLPVYPPAEGLKTPMGGFTMPRHVRHFGTAEYDAYTFSCGGYQGPCAPGYPLSIYYYSYYNYKGIFGPSNPYAPTAYVKVKRLTTSPNFKTTQFGGAYDFSRIGSMKITPGPNRFGGTMRYFFGLNSRWIQSVTTDPTACCEVAAGGVWRTGTGPYGSPTGMLDWTEYSPQLVGGTNISFFMVREHTVLTTGMGEFSTRYQAYLQTKAPWTTGAVSVFQSGGDYVSTALKTGSDNRTENRELGTLSLVTPWLTHMYLAPYNPQDPVEASFHSARVNKIRVTFLPEPGGLILLGAGILSLVGAIRLRRR